MEEIRLNYLFNEVSLYTPVKMDMRINYANDKVDTYCIDCDKSSTFVCSEVKNITGPPYSNLNTFHGYVKFSLKCTRDTDHIYIMILKIKDGEKVIKIGQDPSLRDLASDDIKKYKKVLAGDFGNFKEAIGLNAHGVGAGSFVYLRRIFENLIQEKRELAAEEKTDWSEEAFSRARMDDKIKILSDYLPDFLIENRGIYGILSKGIHELPEEKCLELFPELRLAIELILDEKLSEIEKKQKVSRFSKFVSTTAAALK